MLSPPILITIITVGGFVILAICAFGCFNIFKTNRRRLVKVLEGLKYIPEVIEIKEEYIEVKKKLTKRQQRRKKMRELERELKLSELNEENPEETEDHEDEMEDTFLSSPSSKLISWVINTFSTKSNKIRPNYNHDTDIEIGEPIGFSTKSNYHSNNEDEQQGIGSTKSKRFISQDRIQRKEARILLIQPKNNQDNNIQLQQEEEQKYDTTISLLSLKTAKQEYIKELIEKRKFRKQLCQDTDMIHTDMNEIKVNAGPPAELIPKGYELVSQDLGEELLNPDILIYKRILYLWESSTSTNSGSSGNGNCIGHNNKNKKNSSSEANNTTTPTTAPTPITTATGGNNTNGIIGWYIGTIVGISEQSEYNYRIKYDRKETKSIFVDGIQPVYLSLSGVNAYGRRWVLLQKSTVGS